MGNGKIVEEGSKYVLNTYKRYDVAFVKGEGARVWDADGKEYIDFLGGIAVTSLGYGNSRLAEAISEQSKSILHSSNLFWIEPQVRLAKLICENSFGDKVFFCNSGTEANEAAIKLARKYGISKYGSHRYEIIAMKNSFHGRTMGALSATSQEKYHKPFLPMLPGFKYAEFNNIEDLAEKMDDNVCAVILEPIQGEGGIAPVDTEYIKQVRDLCNKKDVLLMFDEVQCGIGRSGAIFAYEKIGAVPDVMTLAKGLSGGVPVGAMVVSEKLNNVLVPGDHGSTFGGNHLACAAGCVVIEELKSWVLDNVSQMSSYLLEKLEGLKEKYQSIQYIKGMGLMLGIKFDDTADPKDIVNKCFENGFIINSLGNNMIRLVPPLVINKKDIDQGLNILEAVLKEKA